MSEKLDNEVLDFMARIIDSHSQDALLLRRVWSDRQTLVSGLREIQDWDLTHSEALSVDRVQVIVQNLLGSVYEL